MGTTGEQHQRNSNKTVLQTESKGRRTKVCLAPKQIYCRIKMQSWFWLKTDWRSNVWKVDIHFAPFTPFNKKREIPTGVTTLWSPSLFCWKTCCSWRWAWSSVKSEVMRNEKQEETNRVFFSCLRIHFSISGLPVKKWLSWEKKTWNVCNFLVRKARLRSGSKGPGVSLEPSKSDWRRHDLKIHSYCSSLTPSLYVSNNKFLRQSKESETTRKMNLIDFVKTWFSIKRKSRRL